MGLLNAPILQNVLQTQTQPGDGYTTVNRLRKRNSPESQTPPVPRPPPSRGNDRYQARNEYLASQGQTIIPPVLKQWCRLNGVCWWCKGNEHKIGNNRAGTCPFLKTNPENRLSPHQQQQYQQWLAQNPKLQG